MTIKEVIAKMPAKLRIQIGDLDFAPLKWKNPENHNSSEKGPILIGIYGDIGIEVTSTGQFVQVVPLTCDGYSPYFDTNSKERNKQIKQLIKDLTDRLA